MENNTITTMENNIIIFLDLDYNKIIEIKDNELINKYIHLQQLHLSNNSIKDIDGLDHLTKLKKLYLCFNQIKDINKLDKLVNLEQLYLSYNQISEIKGLDNLTNLQILELSSNNVNIDGISHLVQLKRIYLDKNKIVEIKGLDNLVNLQILYLDKNNITEIKGLNNLVNLEILDLSNNQITEIKGLDNLTNLEILDISFNQITEIKGLDNLTCLKKLNLHNNLITEIKGITHLNNLIDLYIYDNLITELPLSLCHFTNLYSIRYSNNPIDYIPLPVQRWLNRNVNNNLVYGDKQNIHNSHIQNSFKTSLNNILKDNILIDLNTIKQQILDNEILNEQSKRELLNYCDDSTYHCTYLITYSDLLIYVWSRIINNENKNEILKVLNQEISDGLCMCFTGRLTRLLNTLVGFYNDIEIQISDSEQITNIIISLKNKYEKDELKIELKKALIERQYSENIINEWLEYI